MPLFDFITQVATVFGSAPDAAHKRVWDEVAPWLKTLTAHAAPKWLPRLASGVTCETVPRGQRCGRSSVAACDVCQRPCCLEHSRIDKFGDAICYGCIAAAIQRAQMERLASGTPPRQHQWAPPPGAQKPPPGATPPPPPPGPSKEEIAAAWKTLKVKPGSSWAEIDESYKELLRKNHPDRQRTPEAKKKAEDRFKAVRAAYDLLKKVHKQ